MAFADLEYDSRDSVEWVADVRRQINKLAARGAAPSEHVVRTTVLRALEEEPEYKTRVDMIRHLTPNIALVDLWTFVNRFPYPLIEHKRDSAFVMKQTSTNIEMKNGRSRGWVHNKDKKEFAEPPPPYKKKPIAPTTMSRDAAQKIVEDLMSGACFT